MNREKHLILGFFCFVSAIAVVLYAADEKERQQRPDPARWRQDAEMFAQWDRKNSFAANAVLFVGSSSIRYWPTVEGFQGLPVINRGFGGSYMADSVNYAEPFILKYNPKVVVVYAGDNDCAGGLSPESIAADFQALAEKIHAALPRTEILCLSIKLSNSRKEYWPRMQQTNQALQAYAQTKEYITYVDVDAVLRMPDGTNDTTLYESDQLHLSEKGYAVWNRLLSPILHERYARAMRNE